MFFIIVIVIIIIFFFFFFFFFSLLGLGNMSTLLNVPFNSHVTLSPDSPCVDNIVLQFFQSLGLSYNPSCLSEFEEPDWDGSSSAAQSYALTVFGT